MDSLSRRERAHRAVDAMKPLGFSKKEVFAVLKNLLQLFDNSWEPIEDECYRALADAILEARDRPQVFPFVHSSYPNGMVEDDLPSFVFLLIPCR